MVFIWRDHEGTTHAIGSAPLCKRCQQNTTHPTTKGEYNRLCDECLGIDRQGKHKGYNTKWNLKPVNNPSFVDRSVECPTCEAPETEDCVNPETGDRIRTVHKARAQAARGT